MKALVFLAMAVVCVASGQQRTPYAPGKVRLTQATHGVNGWLTVNTDARLTTELKNEMWGIGDLFFVVPADDPLQRVFSADPPRNATLQIVNAQDHVVETKTLDRPLARIENISLGKDGTSFLLTVDYSTGMGSYAGLTSQILEVRSG